MFHGFGGILFVVQTLEIVLDMIWTARASLQVSVQVHHLARQSTASQRKDSRESKSLSLVAVGTTHTTQSNSQGPSLADLLGLDQVHQLELIQHGE